LEFFHRNKLGAWSRCGPLNILLSLIGLHLVCIGPISVWFLDDMYDVFAFMTTKKLSVMSDTKRFCVMSGLWAIEYFSFFKMASLGVYRSDFGLVS
jgi:hypothetical protein